MTAIACVIFDLDGVLVDSEIWWDEVRAAFAAEHGRTWGPADQAAVMGANSAAWARIMRERMHLDLPEAEIERAIVDAVVERYRTEGAPRIDGAVETVRRIAADRPVALASSAHRAVIDAALDATGLTGVFAVVVSSDEVAHGKPAPDVYLEAARQLGVDPAACLVVEDSFNGVRAARAAGMTVVLVPNQSVPPAPGTAEAADLVLDRLSELDLATWSGGRAPATGWATVTEPRPRTPATERGRLPGPAVSPLRRTIRYWIARLVASIVARGYLRVRLVGRERLPPGPAIYCFNHMSWADPFVLMAVLPLRPRLWFFGPKEEDMAVGGRNRIMSWTGTTIPYKPGKNDLLEATRRVAAVIASGGVVAIAGEGRIHVRESDLLPLSEGAAYFAMRSGVPLVPDRHPRHELAATRRAGHGRGGGGGADRGPAEPGGRRGRDDAADRRPQGDGRRRPRRRRAGPVRALADRAVQRLAGGLARGRRSGLAGSPVWHTSSRPTDAGGTVAATGLSADPTEYRARLADQSDDQIDAWVAELLRDVVIRRGIVKVVDDFRKATRLDERGFERVFASGGGPPASVGHDAKGRLDRADGHALRPRARSSRPGGGRPRPPDRVPRDELRRDRLRLTGRRTRRAYRRDWVAWSG